MKRFLAFILLTSIAFGQATPKGLQQDAYQLTKGRGGVYLGADLVDQILYQRVKGVYGPDSSVTDVSPAFPLPGWGGLGFGLNVAAGNVTGITSVNKFGRNIELDAADTSDVWDGGQVTAGVSQIWLAPTAAAVHNIVSASDVDSVGNGGALTVQIFGLPRWTSAEISEVITMDGTNDVATDSSYVIIHRMKVLTNGGTSINVGAISATATAPSATTVTALIRAGQGQTQMAIYGVPSTQTAYMGRLYANVNKAVGATGLIDVVLFCNSTPDTQPAIFRTAHTFGLQTVGTSAFTIPYYTPKVFAGPCIIKVQGISGTADMDLSAGFDLMLVNN